MCHELSKDSFISLREAAIVGRTGKDDTGNLIFMWYDDKDSDEEKA